MKPVFALVTIATIVCFGLVTIETRAQDAPESDAKAVGAATANTADAEKVSQPVGEMATHEFRLPRGDKTSAAFIEVLKLIQLRGIADHSVESILAKSDSGRIVAIVRADGQVLDRIGAMVGILFPSAESQRAAGQLRQFDTGRANAGEVVKILAERFPMQMSDKSLHLIDNVKQSKVYVVTLPETMELVGKTIADLALAADRHAKTETRTFQFRHNALEQERSHELVRILKLVLAEPIANKYVKVEFGVQAGDRQLRITANSRIHDQIAAVRRIIAPPPNADGTVPQAGQMRSFELKQVDAASLVNTLVDLLGNHVRDQTVQFFVDPGKRTVHVVGMRDAIEVVATTVALIDNPTPSPGAGRENQSDRKSKPAQAGLDPQGEVESKGLVEIELFSLKHIRARTLTEILHALYPKSDVQIAADETGNRLLVRGRRDLVAELGAVIERLDEAVQGQVKAAAPDAGVPAKPAVELKVQIFRLRNSDAVEIVNSLAQLGYQSDTMVMIPDARSNSILLRGGPPERLREVIAMIDDLDTLADPNKKQAPKLETRRFTLKHRNAGWADSMLQNVYRDLLSPETVVTPDEDVRTLLVRAPKNVLQAIESILPDIDTPVTRAETERDATLEPDNDAFGIGAIALGKDQAAQEFRRHDARALELAAELRLLQSADKPDQERIKQLNAQLQESVAAAFAARQRWQSAELTALQQRVRKLEGVVQSREGSKPQIIQRRVEELLHPEQSWESRENPQADQRKKNEERSERHWQRAEYHLRRGEKDSAAEFAELILRDSPQSSRAPDARDLLRKLGPDHAQGNLESSLLLNGLRVELDDVESERRAKRDSLKLLVAAAKKDDSSADLRKRITVATNEIVVLEKRGDHIRRQIAELLKHSGIPSTRIEGDALRASEVSGSIDGDASPGYAVAPNEELRWGLLQKLKEVALEAELQRAALKAAQGQSANPSSVSDQEVGRAVAADERAQAMTKKLTLAQESLSALKKEGPAYARRQQEIEELQRSLATLTDELKSRMRESLQKAHEEKAADKLAQSESRLAEQERLVKALKDRIFEIAEREEQSKASSQSRKATPPVPPETPSNEAAFRAGSAPVAVAAVDTNDPRCAMIDAEVTASLAREGVSAAEANYENAVETARSREKLAEKGYVTEAQLRKPRARISAAEAEIREARIRRTAAERQLQIARDGLEARINLLQLETELARSKVNHAASKHTRAKDLAAKKAIAANEVEAAQIELMEAQLQHERSRMQLDLYAKAKAAVSSSTEEKRDIPDQSSIEARKHKQDVQANDAFWQAIGLRVVAVNGLRVIEVRQDGPAAAAGIRVDDVLISLNGRETRSTRAAAAIVVPMGRPRPNELNFLLVRGKERVTGTIKVNPAQAEGSQNEHKPEGDSQDESRIERRQEAEKSVTRAPVDQGRQSPGTWLTELDAAVARSKETGRLLLAFYDGKNEQSKAMQKDWFDNPQVQKMIGTVFVAVRIEDDNGPTCMIFKDGNFDKPIFKIVGNTNLAEPFHEKDGIVRLLESLAGLPSK